MHESLKLGYISTSNGTNEQLSTHI